MTFAPPGISWSVGGAARELAVAWSDEPRLYTVPAVAASCALLLSAALAGAAEKWRTGRALAGSSGLFAVLVALTILLGRWPGLGMAEKNPDESEDIASAWALSADPRYGIAADNHTHGPLALASTLLPRVVGWPIEYGSVRLVGLGMAIASCLLLYGILAALFSEPLARVATAPVALFLAWVRGWDYIAFNAEYPSMLLVLGAGHLGVRLGQGDGTRSDLQAAACGVLVGSVPLVKLQAAPLAAAMGLVAVVFLLRAGRGGPRRLILFLAGTAMPALLLLAYLAQAGLAHHFWTSYVAQSIEYSFVQPAGVFWGWLGERWEDDWFVRFFVGSAAATTVAALALAARGRSRSGKTLAAALGLLAVAVFCVYRSGHNYLHYMTLVHYPLALANGAALGVVVEGLARPWARSAAVILFLAVNGAAPLSLSAKEADAFLESASRDEMPGSDVAREVLRYAAPGEPLVIWGWAPRYYVLTGMRPGTRYPHSGFAMDYPYFFGIFLEDFDRSRAPVVIDASEDERPEVRLARYPELAARVERDYEEVARVGTARIYVAKARLRERSATGRKGRSDRS